MALRPPKPKDEAEVSPLYEGNTTIIESPMKSAPEVPAEEDSVVSSNIIT